MTERVREILSWYAGQPGHAHQPRPPAQPRHARRHRQAGHPAGRPGLRARPGAQLRAEPRGLRPALPLPSSRIDAGCNAYAAPLGFLEAGAAEFAGEIPLILKLNNSRLALRRQRSVLRRSPAASTTRCASAAPRSASRSTRARRRATTMYEQISRAHRGGQAQGPRGRGVVVSARLGHLEGRRDGDRRRRLRGADRLPARRAHRQGEAADGAHRAGGGEEGLREGAAFRSRRSPIACATSCSAPSTAGASSSSRAARPRATTTRSSTRSAASATAAASARSSAATRSSARRREAVKFLGKVMDIYRGDER